jgi:hypothetical protein
MNQLQYASWEGLSLDLNPIHLTTCCFKLENTAIASGVDDSLDRVTTNFYVNELFFDAAIRRCQPLANRCSEV